MIEFVDVEEQEEFKKKVIELFNNELAYIVEGVAEQLYDHVVSTRKEIDTEKLARALIATRGRYKSVQDQAAAIKSMLS
jgi:hypothetical protein